MAQRGLPSIRNPATWICRQARYRNGRLTSTFSNKRFFIEGKKSAEEQITAAPEIDFSRSDDVIPARIIPASPSYFTASPIYNDNILSLQQLLERHQALPTLPPGEAPRATFMKLAQYRTVTGEKVPAAKFARVLKILSQFNKIPPNLRSKEVQAVLKRFERPGSAEAPKPRVGKIDEHGRAFGSGRRKESSARVYLVEGSGEVIINGKNIVQYFPRVHDRESALWPLKVSERMDKYNIFASVAGGGVTGQAESVTLGLAKALLVHEPALKPALRRAGCITSDARRVERKKPGRVKARKKPAWRKR